MRLFNQDTKVQALKRAPLFDGLSKKELVALARVTEDLEVPAGGVLCKEGETGQEFFVIVDGKIEVTRKGRRLAARGGGDFVGEIALLEDVPRTATVKAKTTLRVFVLTRQGLSASDRREPVRGAQGHARARPPGDGAVAGSDAGVAVGAMRACARRPMGLGSPGYLLGELPWPPELLHGT